MSATVPTRLLRVSGCLLAGIAFLALGTDVSLARHNHHRSGKSGAVLGNAKAVAPPGSQPSPGPDASQAAKHGTDQGDKGVSERSGKKLPKIGDFTKGDKDAGRGYFHSQAPGIGVKGGARTGAQSGAGATNFIDLSITVQPGRWSKKISKPTDAKKTTRAGSTENFHKHKETLAPDAKLGPARNAVGILGGSTGSTHTGPGPAIDLTAKNAVGGGAKTDASSAGIGLSHQGPGAGPGHLAPSTVSHQGFGAAGTGASNAVVSGNVVRAGSGPGSAGGAAKNMAGINGTMVRPRRCLGGC
jgi:hypothetical protein